MATVNDAASRIVQRSANGGMLTGQIQKQNTHARHFKNRTLRCEKNADTTVMLTPPLQQFSDPSCKN